MESLQAVSPKPSDLMEVFFSYAHEDEPLRNELAKHLKLLERQGVIKAWSDRNITAGEDWRNAIDERLESANIILLLISADFLSSDYCYDIELDRALERHKNKEARVIPVILRSSDWQSAAFGKLAALPTGGKAITSWENEDEAFTDVVKGLRKAIDRLQKITKFEDDTAQSTLKRTKKKIRLFGIDISFTSEAIIVTFSFILFTITFLLSLQPMGFFSKGIKTTVPEKGVSAPDASGGRDNIALRPSIPSSQVLPENKSDVVIKDESGAMSGAVLKSIVKPRVWLLAGTDSKVKTFNQMRVELKKMGIDIHATREKPVPDEGRPDQPEIRYYNYSDQKEAERIAKNVRFILSKTKTIAVYHNDDSAKEGYIEIWLGK